MLIACAAPADDAFLLKAPGKTKLAATTAIAAAATAAPFQLRQKELDPLRPHGRHGRALGETSGLGLFLAHCCHLLF